MRNFNIYLITLNIFLIINFFKNNSDLYEPQNNLLHRKINNLLGLLNAEEKINSDGEINVYLFTNYVEKVYILGFNYNFLNFI